MPARRCLAAILLLAAPAVAATPATRPMNDPPTYKLETAEQWIPAARDLNEKTRAEGIEALEAFVEGRPDLVPLLADTLIHESSAQIFRSICWSLPTMVRVNPAALADRLDGLIGLLQPPRADYSQEEIVDALATLVEGQVLQPGQREKVLAGFSAVVAGGETPSAPRNGYFDHVVDVLGKLSANYPDAGRALHAGLASKSVATRRQVILTLSKVDPTFSASHAAKQIAADLDDVKVGEGDEATDFGQWLGRQTDADAMVGRMAPADRRRVAAAIGRLLRRLPDSSPAGVFYYDVLVSFGPSAGPAAAAVRDYAGRQKGLSLTGSMRAQLDLIAVDTVGYRAEEAADKPVAGPSTAPQPGPSGRR